MRSKATSKTILLLIFGQCIVAVALAWLVNTLVEFSITQTREGNLNKGAASETKLLGTEIASMERTVLGLRGRTNQLGSVHIPTAQEFKDLSSKYRIRIRRLEKQTHTDKSTVPDNDTYSVVCIGRLADDIDFLRALESNFILETDNVVLQRYNDDGSLVALGLTLGVK